MKTNKLFFSVLLGISAVIADVLSPRQPAHASLNQTVEAFGNYVIYHWEQDPQLNTFNPPQIITNVKSSTKVLGVASPITVDASQRTLGARRIAPR